jgi:hypothetical protein
MELKSGHCLPQQDNKGKDKLRGTGARGGKSRLLLVWQLQGCAAQPYRLQRSKRERVVTCLSDINNVNNSEVLDFLGDSRQNLQWPVC